MKKASPQNSAIAENRRARHNFTIGDTFECGIVLKGAEAKSLREHRVNFADAYALVKDGEVFIIGLRIERFKQSTHEELDPERTRKLLLHRKEISRIERALLTKTGTLVPLKIYLKDGRIKVLIGLGVGKKEIDKRATIKERDTKKELARVLKRG